MNGFEALKYMEEAESLPDIILLDVMMPGMSGYEVRHDMAAAHTVWPLYALRFMAGWEVFARGWHSRS